MFRTFIKSALTAGIHTKARQHRPVNDVKLVGTLVNDSRELPSGIKSLAIRTRNLTSSNEDIHTVQIYTQRNFTTGQRVAVFGTLTTFAAEEPSTVVKAHRLYEVEKEFGASSDTDTNFVEIIAKASNKEIYDNTFYLVVQGNDNDQDKTQERSIHLYRAVTKDDEVRNYIRMNIRENDLVHVSGRKMNDSILVNTIHKIEKNDQYQQQKLNIE